MDRNELIEIFAAQVPHYTTNDALQACRQSLLFVSLLDIVCICMFLAFASIHSSRIRRSNSDTDNSCFSATICNILSNLKGEKI